MPYKLDQDARPDEKLLKLYMLLLFNDREYSLTVLSEKLKCSKQTTSRLLNRIDENYPAHLEERKENRQKFYRLKRPSISFRTAIDSNGLRQLALCRDLVKGLLPKEDWDLMDLSLQQAKTNVSRADYQTYEDAVVGQNLSLGAIDYAAFRRELAGLENSIIAKKTCLIRYRKQIDSDDVTYEFAPLRIISFHNALYAWGWILKRNGVKAEDRKAPIKLAVHRMQEVVPQNRSIGDLPDIDPDDGREFGFLQAPPFKAKVYFDRTVATYISDRHWSSDQVITSCEDGGVILDFTAADEGELLSFVMSFGDKARIIEPASLKDKIRKMLMDTLKNYE